MGESEVITHFWNAIYFKKSLCLYWFKHLSF